MLNSNEPLIRHLRKVNTMDIGKMVQGIKAHPQYRDVGMIASHCGIVRSFSRDGRTVTGMDVHFNEAKIEEIIKDIKSRPGIVEVRIDTNNGHLTVGEECASARVLSIGETARSRPPERRSSSDSGQGCRHFH